MSTERTQRLMRQVARRDLFLKLARALRTGFLLSGALFLLFLLAARLGSLVVEPRPTVLLGTLALCTLGFAALASRRFSNRDAFRLVDARAGTNELFLTAALSEKEAGGFGPIVAAQAEEAASRINPTQVVPFQWQRGAGELLGMAALLALALFFLPRLDPFGKGTQRAKLSQQEQRLAELKKATLIRSEQLVKKTPGLELPPVQKALAALEKTFKEARPSERERNLKELALNQKELGELWRKTSNELSHDAFDRAAQSFGRTDARKTQELRDAIKKGDLAPVKKALAEMRDQLQKLAAMPDSAEKRALQQELSQKLNAMAEAVKQAGTSPEANAALARALEQLDKSKLDPVAGEAALDAIESLNLSEKELEQLAEKVRDGETLEEALRTLQMAKQLADREKLDGSQTGDAKSMGDYAALFAEKMAAMGEPGSGGSGMGPGQGNGARRPENDATKSDFKSEQSKSALNGGKMLMEWKTSEVGQTGERADAFQNSMREVKQGVSEAIASEQVPPGYHSAIQKYFDTLPAK
ncbi:MAG: hypothetical protein JWL59_3570 [Chthoniobacteraceae bacterium]|nr:hypothetical protein [Chthoniobacteraceae bacterium]